jgi:hypothetical protein
MLSYCHHTCWQQAIGLTGPIREEERHVYFSEERNQRLATKLFEHIRAGTTDRLDDCFEYDLSIYQCPETAAR